MKPKREVRNIKKIKSSKEKRVSSGIPSLDKMIKGGFSQNSINLIVGGAGSGKSIFGTQFLIQGIKKKEPCLYISFEEEKESFYRNMSGLGWDLDELEKKEDFFFLEYTPEKVKTMLEEGGGIIESLVLRKKIKRIVIDSMNSFELLFDDELKKRESALSLFNILRRWDCTTILLYERELHEGEQESSFKVLDFESDSIIFLYSIKKGDERKRYLEVVKMRGTSHSRKTKPYEISDNGVILK
ncbi:MAG: ATPase domain-containing protein [Candidatus Pacearchaeota archaeon]